MVRESSDEGPGRPIRSVRASGGGRPHFHTNCAALMASLEVRAVARVPVRGAGSTSFQRDADKGVSSPPLDGSDNSSSATRYTRRLDW